MYAKFSGLFLAFFCEHGYVSVTCLCHQCKTFECFTHLRVCFGRKESDFSIYEWRNLTCMSEKFRQFFLLRSELLIFKTKLPSPDLCWVLIFVMSIFVTFMSYLWFRQRISIYGRSPLKCHAKIILNWCEFCNTLTFYCQPSLCK